MSKLKIAAEMLLLMGLIEGCGMMSKSDDEAPKSVRLPQKIAVDIPVVLQEDAQSQKKIIAKSEEDENKSVGFLELKGDVAYLEEQENKLKLDLLFVEPLMEEIVERCQEKALEENCYIPDEALTYVVTQTFKDKITAIDPEESRDYEVGEELVFGDIDFVRYASDALYQYGLSLHDFSAYDSTTAIQWSEDQSHVYSYYEEQLEEANNTIAIDYHVAGSTERMAVEDRLSMVDYHDQFYFNLQQYSPEVYTLNARSKIVDQGVLTQAFASEGTLDANGGEMLFVGVYPEYRLREYERFDALGDALYDEWCTSDDEACLVEDEGTWWYEGDEQYTPEDTEAINARFDRLEERLAL